MLVLRISFHLFLFFIISCGSSDTETVWVCPQGYQLSGDLCVQNTNVKADGADPDSDEFAFAPGLDAGDVNTSHGPDVDSHGGLDLGWGGDENSASDMEGDNESSDEDAESADTGNSGDNGNLDNPWPLPLLDEEPAAPCQAALSEQWYFQFLDNLCEEKVWPTDTDRDRACSTRSLSMTSAMIRS